MRHTLIGWFAGLILFGVVHMPAQTTFATITGLVTDPNGAVMPDVEITVTHAANNYRYTAKTNEVGYYTLAQLREGEYVLSAKSPGFKEYVATGIGLAAQDVRRLDFKLEVGAVETRVEVSAAATLIETENARVGGARKHDTLISLPMNATTPWSFFGLTPGVLLSGDGNFVVKMNGSGSNQYTMAIDGVTMMDGTSGQNNIGPSAPRNETIEEFRIDTTNNSAEFSGVGQITFVSKSGANQIHGTAYDYYSTPVFRARNPFASARGTGIRHAPGFTIGGPIVIPKIHDGHNQTFFFFALDTTSGSPSQQLLNPTVPLASWRAGDFSGLPPGTPIRDPFGGGAVFPGNRIPTSRLSPVALFVQERFYPLPNFGDSSVLQSQNYREQKIRAFDPDTFFTGRIDHRVSDKFTFFMRYQWQRQHSRAFEGNLPTIGQRWQDRNTRNAAISFTQTLRSNLLNEFRAGYGFNNNPRNGPLMGKPLVQQMGLIGLVDNLPDLPGLFKVAFSGLGLTGITQTDLRKPGFRNFPSQFQDHVSWFRGRHGIKTGGQVMRVHYADMSADASLFGNASFSNRFTGFPYADFLLGIPTTVSRGFAPIKQERIWRGYDAFLTDDFKVTPRLTLNLGVRYEYHRPWTEASNRLSIFDADLGKIVVPDGSLKYASPLMPRNYVDVVEASQTNGRWDGTTLLHVDRNNFSPRVGMAYRPWGPNTVIRGGFGLYYDIVARTPSVVGIPYVVSEPSFTNPVDAPTVILPRVFPAAGVGGPSTVGIPGSGSPYPMQPYTLQYNLTIEQQRWSTGFRVSYVGNGTRKGLYSSNINQPVADGRLYIGKPRRFPNYPGVNYTSNGAGHQYHSLNVEAHRNFRNGLEYQADWVWARDLSYGNPEYAYDLKRERGVTFDIPKHRVSANLIYQLPFGRGKRYLGSAGRAVNLAVGGWQIGTVFNVFSGQYLTPSWTGPDPTGTSFTGSTTTPVITIRPDHLRDANLPSDQRSVNRWFDAGAFGPPQKGAFGSAANGVINGPGSWILNTGLYKYFTLRERLRLRWEFTANNVANHPNWGNPSTNISSAAQVGIISGTGAGNDIDPVGPRSMRMGLRVEW